MRDLLRRLHNLERQAATSNCSCGSVLVIVNDKSEIPPRVPCSAHPNRSRLVIIEGHA